MAVQPIFNFQLSIFNWSALRQDGATAAVTAAEVDFVIQHGEAIVPVEVKSGLNLHSRSLHVYRERYKPALSIRGSLQNLKFDNGLLNVPLYLIGELPRLMALL